jgi:hypothetical protein
VGAECNVHLRISSFVDPPISVSIGYRARRRGLRACLHLGALFLHGETRHAAHLRLIATPLSSDRFWPTAVGHGATVAS